MNKTIQFTDIAAYINAQARLIALKEKCSKDSKIHAYLKAVSKLEREQKAMKEAIVKNRSFNRDVKKAFQVTIKDVHVNGYDYAKLEILPKDVDANADFKVAIEILQGLRKPSITDIVATIPGI